MEKYLREIHENVTSWIHEIVPFVQKAVCNKLTINTKSSDFDIVTDVDKKVEQFFREKIHQAYPSHGIIGEESDNTNVKNSFDCLWVIDPIDGTTNFVKQKDHFCLLISFYEKHVGQLGYMYDVMNHDFYYAIRGHGAYLNEKRIEKPAPIRLREGLVSADILAWSQHRLFAELLDRSFGYRYFGCSGIDSIHVINGKFAAFVSTRSGPWDLAAQLIFAEEVGLKTSKFDGSPVNYKVGGDWILANEGCYEEIVELTKRF